MKRNLYVIKCLPSSILCFLPRMNTSVFFYWKFDLIFRWGNWTGICIKRKPIRVLFVEKCKIWHFTPTKLIYPDHLTYPYFNIIVNRVSVEDKHSIPNWKEHSWLERISQHCWIGKQYLYPNGIFLSQVLGCLQYCQISIYYRRNITHFTRNIQEVQNRYICFVATKILE